MIDFSIYCKNHLDTEKVSDDSMNRFGQDCLGRLIGNNPAGIYTPLIAPTTTAYNNYAGAIANETINTTIKEESTVTVDTLKKQFIDLVAMKEGIIRGTFGKDAAQYQRFFPHGVDEYHQSNKANIQTLMAQFISGCGAYRDQLPANFVVQFETLAASYKDARDLQLVHIGNVDGNKLVTASMRSILEIQLMTNLLTIAKNNIGNPAALEVYFDQSIIRRPTRSKTEGELAEEEPMSGQVAPESKATIMHGGYDANTGLSLRNPGSTVVQYYTANMPDDPVPGTRVELQPGEEVETFASELGAEGNLFLMVYNTSTTTAGSYEVLITDEIIE
jgi:hypothetical protein